MTKTIKLPEREKLAMEEDNFPKCAIIEKLNEQVKALQRENFGLRKQVENLRQKEEARYKSDAWVDQMNNVLNKAKYEQALKDFTGAVMRSPSTMKFDEVIGKQILKGRYQRQHDLLKQLIDEHFDNPPLKFEEIVPGMWVWDKKYDAYYLIVEDDNKLHYAMFVDAIEYELMRFFEFEFEPRRFYKRRVEE